MNLITTEYLLSVQILSCMHDENDDQTLPPHACRSQESGLLRNYCIGGGGGGRGG